MQQYFLLQGKGLQLPKGDKEVAAENNSSGIFLAVGASGTVVGEIQRKRGWVAVLKRSFLTQTEKFYQKLSDGDLIICSLCSMNYN